MKTKYEEGQSVTVYKQDDSLWGEGEIELVNHGGTLQIRFDDGDVVEVNPIKNKVILAE